MRITVEIVGRNPSRLRLLVARLRRPSAEKTAAWYAAGCP
jgi:hypothetical protein